ncbi:MAG TPA: hypothetical protein VNJ07_06450 [Chitinophagales bacterium]|nr:hypothetical protein [Chitinophagales bacterium]
MNTYAGKIAKAALLLSYLTLLMAIVSRLGNIGVGPLSYRAWIVATGLLLLIVIANNTLKKEE